MGGMLAALESGWLRKEIKREGLERARKIADKRWLFIDENETIVPEEEIIPVKVFNYGGDRRRINERVIASCKKFKETRNLEKVKHALGDLRQKVERKENLIYPMIEAFKAYATRGEVLGTIREGFGYNYDPFNIIQRPAFLAGEN
jgi:methylmalonyl-CoA mutase N-terminal domain/subunit